MNQAILLNNDLTFNAELQVWQLTGFYHSQAIIIFIDTEKLPAESKISQGILFELEDEIECWLEHNEPDIYNNIWLK